MISRWAAWAAPLCVASALTAAAPAAAQTLEANFSIPAQPLPRALISYGDQAGVAIAAPRELTARLTSRAVAGRMTSAEALRQLLVGTGLSFEFIDARTVRVFREQGAEPIAASDAVSSEAQEIIVTAQKREQRLSDVPIAVTAISNDDLQRAGVKDSDDYLASIPGVSFARLDAGNNTVVIRGISTTLVGANEQATTEVLLDDIPSLNRYFSRYNTDLRLVDVERIEVLRGPQGTLFGSGALGGAIRIITNKPDPSRFEAFAEAGLATTKGGDESYNFEGVVNVPIVTDKLALRAVGYYSQEGGFVDNIFLGRNNVDRGQVYGGRAILSFSPTDRTRFRITAIHQRDDYDDAPLTFAFRKDGSPDEVDARDPNNAYEGKTTVLNAVLEYDFGQVSLFSSTAYLDRKAFLIRDLTRFWQARVMITGNIDDTVQATTETFTQELRLQSNGSGRFQWLIGGFYLDQDVDAIFRRTGDELQRQRGAPSNVISQVEIFPVTQEAAIFAEGSYRLTESLTLTAGLRLFKNKLKFDDTRSGFLGGAPTEPRTNTESSLTPKFAALYEVSDNVNIYALAARGFRTGQNNFGALPDPVTGFVPPESYGPDNLWNYEIGLKSNFADGRVRLNLAAFYIDWKNIQLTRRTGRVTYTDNAGDASSRGLEVELSASPVEWLDLGVAMAYIDARLDSVLPGVGAQPGRLPGSAEVTSSEYVQLSHTLREGASAYLRVDHRYVGDKVLEIGGVGGLGSDDYHLVDVRAGLNLGRYEFIAFIDNLANNAASLAPNVLPDTPLLTIRQRPRTAGLTVRARF